MGDEVLVRGGKREMTEKQTEFVRLVSLGKNQTQAYVEAFSAKNRKHAKSAASILMRREDLRERVRELRLEAEKHTIAEMNITRKDMYKKYEFVFNQCVEKGDLKTALGCVISQAKMLGFMNTKVDVTNKTEVAVTHDFKVSEDWERIFGEKVKKIGKVIDVEKERDSETS